MANETFVLVNGGYEPVLKMEVRCCTAGSWAQRLVNSRGGPALSAHAITHMLALSWASTRPHLAQAGRYQRWRVVNTGAAGCSAEHHGVLSRHACTALHAALLT